jgi:hypothetical protein
MIKNGEVLEQMQVDNLSHLPQRLRFSLQPLLRFGR